MDRAIDTAAAEQRGIGRVDDRVDGQPGDVAALDANARGWGQCHFGRSPDLKSCRLRKGNMAHAAVSERRAAALGQGLCVEFLAEISTKQSLFDNFAVSVVNGDAARLVEFGQPAR